MKTLATGLIALAAAFGSASLFDNTASNTSQTIRGAEDAPAMHLTNTNAYDVMVTKASFLGNLNMNDEVKFSLADSTGMILNSVTASMADTGWGLYGVAVNWNLEAGKTYFIVATTRYGGANYGYTFPGGYAAQNGIQPLVNGNFYGYADQQFYGTAGASMNWQLESVPEPTSIAAAAVAGLGFLRRRRNSK